MRQLAGSHQNGVVRVHFDKPWLSRALAKESDIVHVDIEPRPRVDCKYDCPTDTGHPDKNGRTNKNKLSEVAPTVSQVAPDRRRGTTFYHHNRTANKGRAACA